VIRKSKVEKAVEEIHCGIGLSVRQNLLKFVEDLDEVKKEFQLFFPQ
jgi:hypothetical protein